MVTVAEKALEDRAKLVTHYHRAVAAAWREAIAEQPGLGDVRAWINRCRDPDEMIEIAQLVAELYPAHRALVLSLIDRRIQTLRIRAGMHVFDDPLAGEDTDNCFQCCKRVLT
jgi:hypothetical protein